MYPMQMFFSEKKEVHEVPNGQLLNGKVPTMQPLDTYVQKARATVKAPQVALDSSAGTVYQLHMLYLHLAANKKHFWEAEYKDIQGLLESLCALKKIYAEKYKEDILEVAHEVLQEKEIELEDVNYVAVLLAPLGEDLLEKKVCKIPGRNALLKRAQAALDAQDTQVEDIIALWDQVVAWNEDYADPLTRSMKIKLMDNLVHKDKTGT